MKPVMPSFWVTNLSQLNVSLADLNLTIRARSSVNLLDSKHYSYTVEQLQKSAQSGSIFKKRDKIVVRKFAPEVIESKSPMLRETHIASRERSILEVKEEKYDELNMSDEQFASDNAETAELDTKPLFLKKG